MRFVDTSVLLYAVSAAPEEGPKRRRANEVLAARDLGLSVQVLQEFYVQATRASRPDRLTHDQALGLLESFLRFPLLELDSDLVRAAAATSDAHRISYWDAAIIEAARALGCAVVLSEDLSSGGSYGGMRVENPFDGI